MFLAHESISSCNVLVSALLSLTYVVLSLGLKCAGIEAGSQFP